MGSENHKNVVGEDLHISANSPNLIENGSFQKFTSGTTSQPDGFSNEGTPDILRDTGERDNWFSTPYAVKYTATGAANEGGNITLSNLKPSTTYAVHVRAKATAGDTARLLTTGGATNIDTETVLTTWTYLRGIFVTDATPTAVVIKLVAKADGDIVWFDKLVIREGEAYGEFVPHPNDVVGSVVEASVSTPIFWNMLTAAPDTTPAGTWARGWNDATFSYAGYFYNSTSADLDNFTVNFRCPAGTYTLRFNYSQGSNRGIVDVDIDAVEKGSQDMYNVVQSNQFKEITGLSLSAGSHVLKFRLDGKNGSSSDYFFLTSGIYLQKTA